MSDAAGIAHPTVLERILRDYRAFGADLPDADTRGLAAARLSELGWPSGRDEQWRYANLRAFERLGGFLPAGPGAAPTLTLPPLLAGFDRLVYIDGRHASGTHPALAAGGGARGPDTAVRWEPEQRLGLLAEMFATDPVRLDVRGEAAIELLLFSHAGQVSYPRIDLRLAPGSRLQLIERHLGCDGRPAGQPAGPGLVACGVTAELARDATLLHYRLQQADPDSIVSDTLRVRVEEQAHYAVRHVAVGGGSARTSASVELAGRGARLEWAGIAVGRGEQVHDTSLRVQHAAPETSTEEVFRGIADGRARVAFNGHIRIDATAVGSQTRQSLRGLIEGNAEIDLRPRLEILTDDVRASHGATTGRLDEDLLFYLLARGIDRPTARALLKWAFLGDVLRQIDQPLLRREAERLAAGQLPEVPSLSIGASA